MTSIYEVLNSTLSVAAGPQELRLALIKMPIENLWASLMLWVWDTLILPLASNDIMKTLAK